MVTGEPDGPDEMEGSERSDAPDRLERLDGSDRLGGSDEAAVADRIQAGLLAYAAGDALGVPWEGRAPSEIRMDRLEDLPARKPWPPGSTSDDTALTLLVAEHLAESGGVGEPLDLLATLAGEWPRIPGLGPSTRRAIEHFVATGTSIPGDGGADTNGAAMRALPVGWAVPVAADDRRRRWVLALTRVTHTGREALAGAAVMTACASSAVDGASPDHLVEIASREAAAVDASTAVAYALDAVARQRWTPPEAGISLAPSETVAAVLHCCRTAGDDLDAALRAAVSLGGDTDTVAALVGGLLGCRLRPPEVEHRLPWLDRARLPARSRVASLAAELARIRRAAEA